MIKKELTQKQRSVMILEEIAPLFKNYLHKDPMLLQSYINKMELCRIDYLQALKHQNIFDVILVDRTPKDNIAYTRFLQEKGKLDPDFLTAETDECPYDCIILYKSPMKSSSREDEELLRDILWKTISEYPCTIIELNNFRENLEETIEVVNEQYIKKNPYILSL